MDTSRLLARLGFTGPHELRRRVEHLARPEARESLAEILPYLLLVLGDAASPGRALVSFERFAGRVPDQAAFYRHLAEDPRAIETLVTLFAGSQFLTEILLRHPEYFPRLLQRRGIVQVKAPEQFAAEAFAAVSPWFPAPSATDPKGRLAVPTPALDALRQYQQWQLLRIGMSDLSGLLDLATVTAQLSHLADAIVQVCLSMLAERLALSLDGFAVLALGKLGGEELNYSSDIDLLFLAAADATTYQRLGERLIQALGEATGAGFLYRVDMRLRPWGRVGPLVISHQGYLAYLARHARLWEKQALLKARVIAGSTALGDELLRQAEPLLYAVDPQAARADVHAMKRMTEEHLRRHGREWGEVKLGEGSIRDVEFVVQYLQLAYGDSHPELRGGNTLAVLARLADAGFLSKDERRILADGYIFLRTVEHYLQILDYRQTYTLPAAPGELAYLAERLGYHGPDAAAQFVARYQQHSAAIRAIYQHYLDPGAWPYPSPPERNVPPAADNGVPGMSQPSKPFESLPAADQAVASAALTGHVGRMAPAYAAAFSPAEIGRHAELLERLSPEHPVEVRGEPLDDDNWRVTVVGYDFQGELSLICGLLFVYGFSIAEGHVFTYEPQAVPAAERLKIVDVFTVHSVLPDRDPTVWLSYAADLTALLRLMQDRQPREAQGELAKRVGVAVRELPGAAPTMQPIGIEIDNDTSSRYTILRIDAADTIGFLYELTNALALNDIQIAQVAVASEGSRVQDTLYITDSRGRKIVDRERQRQLRAATVLVKHFTHLLPMSPNPESALLHFHEYLGQLFRQSDWPDQLASLERPEVLEALAQLLGVSDFLWDDFLRMQHENLFPVVRDVAALPASKSKAQLAQELAARLQGSTSTEQVAGWRDELNAFKDREMFRIDMRNILGYTASPGQFSAELTDLAEVVVEAAFQQVSQELQRTFGTPLAADGRPSTFAVCALGKSGGRELGYASDIELMVLYDSSGETTGPRAVSTAEYYERLVQEVVRAIRARREGIFEIDLQLRPYGSAGSLAVSLESFRRYFAPTGAAWSYERQALIKLRPIAGDGALAEQILALRDQYVYGDGPFDVTGMRAMRERQLRHLVTPGTINAKYSLGGLVDVEYLVQGLQIAHGGADPGLRLCNTQEAMAALAWSGIISPEDYARLRAAHGFLLRLIDALRVVRGNSKDLTVPPPDSEEYAFLARRLGYGTAVDLLSVDLTDHITWVQDLTTSLLG